MLWDMHAAQGIFGLAPAQGRYAEQMRTAPAHGSPPEQIGTALLRMEDMQSRLALPLRTEVCLRFPRDLRQRKRERERERERDRERGRQEGRCAL